VKATKAAIVLFVFIVLLVQVSTVMALIYNPGVVPGNYVKLGNFTSTDPSISVYSQMDWLKYEVTTISGENVTLMTTGAFKNGTAITGNGGSAIFNIATSTVNGYSTTNAPVIPSNLNQGDQIPNTTSNVTKTENRNYLGQSRTVNIVEQVQTQSDATFKGTFVYDRSSGIVLEVSMERTNSTATASVSFSVIETNVFGATPTPSPASAMTASLSESASALNYGNTVNFTVSTDGGVPPYNFTWYVDGQVSASSSLPYFSINSLPVGSHHVYVKVNDANGNSATTLANAFEVLPALNPSSTPHSTPSPSIVSIWENNIVWYFIGGAAIAFVVLLVLFLLRRKG
jgi:hypothetical protein